MKLQSEYYIHFEAPIDEENLFDVFLYADFPVHIQAVLPNSYFLATQLSYSQLQFSLKAYYDNEKPLGKYALMKIKEGTGLVIVPQTTD